MDLCSNGPATRETAVGIDRRAIRGCQNGAPVGRALPLILSEPAFSSCQLGHDTGSTISD